MFSSEYHCILHAATGILKLYSWFIIFVSTFLDGNSKNETVFWKFCCSNHICYEFCLLPLAMFFFSIAHHTFQNVLIVHLHIDIFSPLEVHFDWCNCKTLTDDFQYTSCRTYMSPWPRSPPVHPGTREFLWVPQSQTSWSDRSSNFPVSRAYAVSATAVAAKAQQQPHNPKNSNENCSS